MGLYVLVYGRSGFLSLFQKRYMEPASGEIDLRLCDYDVDVRFSPEHKRYSILIFSFILVDSGAVASVAEIDYLLEHFPGTEVFLIGESEAPEIKLKLKNKKYRRLCRHVKFHPAVAQIISRSIEKPL